MRVLVVAEEPSRRSLLARAVRGAGHEPSGASDAREVSLAVQRTRPDALVVELPEDGSTSMRRLLERARGAAEARLPAVFLLPEHSIWLRGPLPPDLMPAAAVCSTPSGEPSFERALADLVVAGDAGRHDVPAAGELRLDALRREVAGPSGAVRLTESETTVLAAVVEGRGSVVTSERVADALWGRPVVDKHSRAAIRSHVHTLRRKLGSVGLDGLVVSHPGVGYRLATPDQRAEGGG